MGIGVEDKGVLMRGKEGDYDLKGEVRVGEMKGDLGVKRE